jgi:uncharacterized membrane protein YgcG
MRFALALLTLLVLAGPARADERILSFDADITVHQDASMSVRETLRVRAEGVNIRRGIYRDFPTVYRDRFGNDIRVRFTLQGVSREGQVEPSRVESRSNGVRVYIGDPDVFLEPGEYSYVLAYETDRQLGYFAEHDELYWNVTGNGWLFPIDRVSARVRLPADVPMDRVTIEGYVGLLGAKGREFAGEVTADGAMISATRPLRPREGLTLAATWPEGHVHEPDAMERVGYLLADNRGLLIALTGLLLVLGYLHLAWRQHGRDPRPGVIFPHYEPPAGYSPASMRFIAEMGYDNRAFAAAVINLAVKGYLNIAQGEHFVLRRTTGGQSPLAAGEQALLKALFADGELLALEQGNHRRIAAARAAHLKALQRDYERIYFQTNRSLLLPAGVIVGLVLLALFFNDAFTPAVIVVLVLTGIVVLLYRGWLKAATPRGRALLDRLDGFRMYLEVAEKDELALRNPPEKTPELFERLLPFALALGVEQAWAERFADVFASLEADTPGGYRPAWYAGQFDSRDLGGFTRDVGRSFSSAIAAAAAAPGSASGSGGGGFSGGGGGGGGGGGW